jgi:hypothetical protein
VVLFRSTNAPLGVTVRSLFVVVVSDGGIGRVVVVSVVVLNWAIAAPDPNTKGAASNKV